MWIDTDKKIKLQEEELHAVSKKDWITALIIRICFLREFNEKEQIDKGSIRKYLQQIGENYVFFYLYILDIFGLEESVNYNELAVEDISILLELVAEYYRFFQNEKNYDIFFRFLENLSKELIDKKKIKMVKILLFIILFEFKEEIGTHIIDTISIEDTEELAMDFPEIISDFYFKISVCEMNLSKQWKDSLYFIDRAIDITVKNQKKYDYNTYYLLSIKAEILVGDNQHEEASKIAKKVLEEIPNDQKELYIYPYIISASIRASYMIEKGYDSIAFDLLYNIDSLLEKIKDDKEFVEQYELRNNMTFLQLYIYTGNLKKQEEYALKNYNFTLDLNKGVYEYLVSANGLLMVYISSGRVDEARSILNQACDLIHKNGLKNLEISNYIFQIKKSMNSSLIEYIKTKLYMCNNVKVDPKINFSQLYMEIENCIDSLKRKNCGKYKTRKIAEKLEKIVIIINEKYSHNLHVAIEMKIGEIYIARNLKHKCNLKKHMIEVFELAEKTNEMSKYDNYSRIFLRVFDFCAILFSISEVANIIEKLIQGMCFRYNYLLNLGDENLFLKALWQNIDIIKTIVLLEEQKKIQISDEMLIELIQNGKNMYLSLLKDKHMSESKAEQKKQKEYEAIKCMEKEQIRNILSSYFLKKPINRKSEEEIDREKQKIYIEIGNSGSKYQWKKIDDILKNIDHAICLNFTSYPKTFDRVPRLLDMRYLLIKVTKNGESVDIERIGNVNLYLVRVGIALIEIAMSATKENKVVDFLMKMGEKLIAKHITNKLKLWLKSKVDKIYINSDFDIHRLPLSFIKITNHERIIDRYDLIYCDSLIDIEEKNSRFSLKSALVIGNPKFSVFDKNNLIRFKRPEMEALTLPLSKVEAGIVADKLNVEPILRDKATKNIICSSQADIIHMATHGICLNSELDESILKFPELICSCILLSGVNDWLKTGIVDDTYGNGILTAKEVIMSTTLKPQLVVLSTCFGASGVRSRNSGMIGMATAFKVVGAKAIIANLWEVDDLAAAVLMERFYSTLNYNSPVKALRDAQLYIRALTIQEMDRNKWFDTSKLRRMGSNAEDVLKLKEKPDDYKPFSNPKYWSGFICEY